MGVTYIFNIDEIGDKFYIIVKGSAQVLLPFQLNEKGQLVGADIPLEEPEDKNSKDDDFFNEEPDQHTLLNKLKHSITLKLSGTGMVGGVGGQNVSFQKDMTK